MSSLIFVTRIMAAVAVGFSSLCALTATGFIMPPSRTTQIVGQLTFKGRPIDRVTIVFTPKEARVEEEWGLGATDPEGNFTITGRADESGLRPGDYTIHLLKETGPDAAEPSALSRPRIPERFFDAKKSNMSVYLDGSASCKVHIDLHGGPAS